MGTTTDKLTVIAGWVVDCTSGLEHDYATCAEGCLDGYVYRFPDMVRVGCTCKDGKIEVFSAPGDQYAGLRRRAKAQGERAPFWIEHPPCQGRRWNVSQDVGVWIEVMKRLAAEDKYKTMSEFFGQLGTMKPLDAIVAAFEGMKEVKHEMP